MSVADSFDEVVAIVTLSMQVRDVEELHLHLLLRLRCCIVKECVLGVRSELPGMERLGSVLLLHIIGRSVDELKHAYALDRLLHGPRDVLDAHKAGLHVVKDARNIVFDGGNDRLRDLVARMEETVRFKLREHDSGYHRRNAQVICLVHQELSHVSEVVNSVGAVVPELLTGFTQSILVFLDTKNKVKGGVTVNVLGQGHFHSPRTLSRITSIPFLQDSHTALESISGNSKDFLD